ncbi:Rv1733c family protein [Williamsia sp. SKLECPSW1]
MSGDQRPPTRRVHPRRSVARTDRVRRHPLERDIDIRERRLQLLLGFVGLLMLPLAIVPGIVIWASQDEAPPPVITMVNATTDTAAPPVTPIATTLGRDDVNTVVAHWTFEGRPHTGRITVPPGTEAGSKLLLTVDELGEPTPPVPLRADSGVTGVAVAVVLVGLVIAIYLALRALITTRCDRVRMERWDEDLARLLS